MKVQLKTAVDAEHGMPLTVDVWFVEPATRQTIAHHSVATKSGDRLEFSGSIPLSQSGWSVFARAPGWWSSNRYVAPDGRTASLLLVPEGIVKFELVGGDSGLERLVPGDVRIAGLLRQPGRYLPTGVHGGLCAFRKPTSDGESVHVSCPFARGETADVQVSLGPFLPITAPRLGIGESVDLGVIEIVRGAMLTGVLRSGEDRSHLLGLRSRTISGTLPVVEWSDISGAFSFEGLVPGKYELQLVDAPLARWPITIPELTSVVDVGEIASPGANRMVVSVLTPSSDELELRPVATQVARSEDGVVEILGSRVESQERDVRGLYVWKGLPVGSYRIDLEDLQGNRWGREIVEFFGDDQFFLEIQALPIEGRIQRGADPVEDVLVWVGGLNGVERVSLRSDDEGRFGGFIPRSGRWLIDVTPAPSCDPCEGPPEDGWEGFAGGAERLDLGLFDLQPGANGVVELRLSVPGGGVSGRVALPPGVDLGPQGAHIYVHRISRVPWEGEPTFWQTRAGEEGEYSVSGVPEGDYRVYAEQMVAGRLFVSPETQVGLADTAVKDLELRLREFRSLDVTVRSGPRPVLGARVLIRPVATSIPSDWGSRTTNGLGMVHEWLPRETLQVDVLVVADNFGLIGRRVRMPETSDPLIVELFPTRGELRVPRLAGAAMVTPEGMRVGLERLEGYGVAQVEEESLVLSGLAPGKWLFCPPSRPCRTGQVLPWAAVDLDP
ncbi:MAG: hypothetical protein OXG74_06365 [Acidobacteria bacterium]|nr:hypothetical protein [Acidobacteriota bacterium]